MRKIQSGSCATEKPAGWPSSLPLSDSCLDSAVSEAWQELPEIRMDRVLEMRRRIARGYHPAAEDLADSVLRRADTLRSR